MKLLRSAWLGAALVSVLLTAPVVYGVTDDNGFVRVSPDEVKWTPVEGGLGAQNAVIEGDPTKPGLYVMWIKFPPGVMSRPHYHTQDRHLVVLKGTWWTGTGTEFTPDKTIPLKPGSYMKHPARAAHFDGAKDEEVILQVIGIGPFESPRIKPEDGGYGYSMKK
ncbi:MAG TPA: cupin domain-containing protein [Bryobacteraceae bacterium]|jgi:hypothetical protein